MLRMILNNRGVTIIEAMVATFLVMTAIIALMSMFPIAMQTSGSSDYMGRAIGIMQMELELRESQIMRNNIPFTGNQFKQVKVSDPFGVPGTVDGDATINVSTTITQQAGQSYLVTVNVTWAGNVRGITNSTIVTPQVNFI